MKLEQNFTINNDVVTLVAEFSGIKVFSKDCCDDEKIIYFCKNATIIQALNISVGCSQGMAYIDLLKFYEVK